MVGFIVGTVCLIGLVKVLRHRGCGTWRGRGGYRGRGRRGWRGGFGGWGLERALDALDARPEQEDVIRRELRTLRNRRATLRDEADRTRADMIDALRADQLDEEAIASVFVRHDELLSELRGDVVGAFGRIHAVLDPEQREQVASWIERGRARHRGGPYRSL